MRKTLLLESVKSIFKSVGKPLNVSELTDFLKEKNLFPNKTSLYRMLERMKSEDFIENILLDSKTSYYELKTYHHHHFRCQSCEKIRCITDPELEFHIHALEEKLKKKGFTIEDHQFSLSGRCTSCI